MNSTQENTRAPRNGRSEGTGRAGLYSMQGVMNQLAPSITKIIRMDHAHVLLTAHKYTLDAAAWRKEAIVRSVCLALSVHAQVEEEIFYPRLREMLTDTPVLDHAKPEHEEMRQIMEGLSMMRATDAGYDEKFMQLMRIVLHHVADEETVLLPAAESLLRYELGELGARMARRKMQLLRPHASEIAKDTARTMPVTTMLAAGGLIASGYLLGRGLVQRRH
jgi:hemerythrin superfamily protein